MTPVTSLPSVVSVIAPAAGKTPVLRSQEKSHIAETTPERLSVAVKGMTTGVLYQPARSARCWLWTVRQRRGHGVDDDVRRRAARRDGWLRNAVPRRPSSLRGY